MRTKIIQKIAICLLPVNLFLSVLFACSTTPHRPIEKEFLPPHTLASIIAELKIYQSADIYRFSYPQTPAGQNVFKATIQRLENFQALYPEEFTDIVNFSLALALEKLGNTKEAARYYHQVANEEDSPLKTEAQRRLSIVEKINTAYQIMTPPATLQGLLLFSEQRIYNLSQLLKEIQDREYKPLILLLHEQAQLELVLLLKDHYTTVEDGVKKTLSAFNSLIEGNKESKLVWAHRLRLADFYYQLAKDYVGRSSPSSPDFSEEKFKFLAEPARRLYYEISLADGYPEKLEAEHKLSAINSFITTILAQSR